MLRGFQCPAWLAWAVTALYAVLLVTGTHLPPDHAAVEEAARLTLHEKLTHFGAYFVLALLVFVWIGVGRSARLRVGLLIGLVILAAADEWTQPPFGREADIGDWLADVCGLVLGCLTGMAFRRPSRPGSIERAPAPIEPR